MNTDSKSVTQRLFFLLGLVSTWQIVQIAGFAASTVVTVLTAGYLLLTREFVFPKDRILLVLLLTTCLTAVVSLFSDIPIAYKKTALTGAVQWGLLFVLCAYMLQETHGHTTGWFFRGFDWSCRVQLIWCGAQMLLYYGAEIELNDLVFAKVLGFSGETGQYRGGVLACTGLHWHAANLIPVLLYTFFRHRSLLVKVLCVVIVYFTKNATAMIAVGFSAALELFLYVRAVRKHENRKLSRCDIAVIVALIALSPLILSKLWEMARYLALRFWQIQNPTPGHESSAVHVNYYRNLPEILSRIPGILCLLGSGIGTSGHWYTRFYGQYPDMVWVAESDLVDGVLSKGILGAVLQYGFILHIAICAAKQKQWEIASFLAVLLVSGFAYGNQFLWVQLLELMLYCRLRRQQVSQ